MTKSAFDIAGLSYRPCVVAAFYLPSFAPRIRFIDPKKAGAYKEELESLSDTLNSFVSFAEANDKEEKRSNAREILEEHFLGVKQFAREYKKYLETTADFDAHGASRRADMFLVMADAYIPPNQSIDVNLE